MHRATDSFSYGGRVFNRATILPNDDPAVVKFPHLFECLDEAPVERATARPGEQRTTRRPKAD
jgi:hypothetical protein